MKNKRETKKPKNQGARLEGDLFDMFEEPKRDIYEETVHSQRDFILGDDWLMLYCLDVAARDAVEKGDDACWELLDNCDCDLVEALKVDCGGNPKVIVKELLRLTEG